MRRRRCRCRQILSVTPLSFHLLPNSPPLFCSVPSLYLSHLLFFPSRYETMPILTTTLITITSTTPHERMGKHGKTRERWFLFPSFFESTWSNDKVEDATTSPSLNTPKQSIIMSPVKQSPSLSCTPSLLLVFPPTPPVTRLRPFASLFRCLFFSSLFSPPFCSFYVFLLASLYLGAFIRGCDCCCCCCCCWDPLVAENLSSSSGTRRFDVFRLAPRQRARTTTRTIAPDLLPWT